MERLKKNGNLCNEINKIKSKKKFDVTKSIFGDIKNDIMKCIQMFEIKINKNLKREYSQLLKLLDLNNNATEEEVINKILDICREFYENKIGANLNIGFGGGYEYKTLKKLLIHCWKDKTLKHIEDEYKIKQFKKDKYLIKFSFPGKKQNLKNIIKYEKFPTTEWKIKNFGKPGWVKLYV